MDLVDHPSTPSRRRRRGRRLALGTLLAAVLAPGIAAAAATVPLEALLRAVAAWTAAELELAVPQELPRVVFSTPARMLELRYGSAEGSAGAADVVALYDLERRTIHLARGWTGATPAELSVLVNEMVHHVQAAAGLEFACPGARETEAYALQARWLEQFGLELYEEFELNALTVTLLTICGRP
jgi:hypothetical protein